MKNLLCIFLFSIFLFSCSGNRKVMKDLKKIHSAPIALPQHAFLTMNGKDTTIASYLGSEIKMVVFMDSSVCSSCVISKMAEEWNPYIEYANSIGGKLKYYFIFAPSPSQKRSLRLSLKTHPLNYPILIDENGEFTKLNPHLPNNRALHTFLLDKNNKITLIGAPTEHEYLKEKFFEVTQKLLNQ